MCPVSVFFWYWDFTLIILSYYRFQHYQSYDYYQNSRSFRNFFLFISNFKKNCIFPSSEILKWLLKAPLGLPVPVVTKGTTRSCPQWLLKASLGLDTPVVTKGTTQSCSPVVTKGTTLPST